MQSEEPTIIQSLEDHLKEFRHTTVGQDIAAAILVIRDLHQKDALSTDAEPVACEYGHDNGDGTYSPTYARWPLPPHVKPHGDMPVKLFYAAPPAPSVAVKALDTCAVDLLLYNLLREAIQEGMDKATNPDWVTKDFTHSGPYVALRSALSAQVQDVAGDADDYYGNDPAELKRLLAQRDKWLVDNDHWYNFTRSLPAAPAKQEG